MERQKHRNGQLRRKSGAEGAQYTDDAAHPQEKLPPFPSLEARVSAPFLRSGPQSPTVVNPASYADSLPSSPTITHLDELGPENTIVRCGQLALGCWTGRNGLSGSFGDLHHNEARFSIKECCIPEDRLNSQICSMDLRHYPSHVTTAFQHHGRTARAVAVRRWN